MLAVSALLAASPMPHVEQIVDGLPVKGNLFLKLRFARVREVRRQGMMVGQIDQLDLPAIAAGVAQLTQGVDYLRLIQFGLL